jgi:hypothetical protein
MYICLSSSASYDSTYIQYLQCVYVAIDLIIMNVACVHCTYVYVLKISASVCILFTFSASFFIESTKYKDCVCIPHIW